MDEFEAVGTCQLIGQDAPWMLELPDRPIGGWGFYTYLDVDLVEAQRGYPCLWRLVAYVSLKLLNSRKTCEGTRFVDQMSECDQRVRLAASVIDGQLAVRLVAPAVQP